MKIIELFEMASPRDSDRNKTYYHGTLSEDKAKSIFKNGLDPDFTVLKYGTRKSALRPEDNSVYITPALDYAMIYALGGAMFGHTVSQRDIDKYGEYCFVFEINGNDLADIGPDEDSVGELIWKINSKRIESNRSLVDFIAFAKNKLTPTQYKKCIEGDYNGFAMAGKKLNAIMTDEQKLAIIDSGAHISHKGKLKISKCWTFSRNDSKNIKPDGSNFFEFAKIWKP